MFQSKLIDLIDLIDCSDGFFLRRGGDPRKEGSLWAVGVGRREEVDGFYFLSDETLVE